MINLENKEKYNKGFKQYIDFNCAYRDFPKPGVNFIDVFPLLARNNLLDFDSVLTIKEPLVVVPESRAFLFAGSLGLHKIVPIRKKGKLPGTVLTYSATKEYGSDELEVSLTHFRRFTYSWLVKEEPIPVCFFDDVIATGGTAKATVDFINNLKINDCTFRVTTVACYIYLPALGASKLLNCPIESVYDYD